MVQTRGKKRQQRPKGPLTNASHLQISELAKKAGVSIRTVRYYEELGLLQPSGWTSGGMRLYNDTDVARLRFIRRLRTLRLSLGRIKQALGLERHQNRKKRVERTLQVLQMEQAHAEEQMNTLKQIKEEVEGAITNVTKCATCTVEECPETCPRLAYLL